MVTFTLLDKRVVYKNVSVDNAGPIANNNFVEILFNARHFIHNIYLTLQL